MEHRVGRTLRVFLLVLAAAGFHRLTIVPLVEPRVPDPQESLEMSPEQAAAIRSRADRRLAALGDLFPAGSWEREDPIMLESRQMRLLFKQYQLLPDGRVNLVPCTMVLLPDRNRAATAQAGRTLVLRAPQGAVLAFDEPLDLRQGRLARLVGGSLRGQVTIRGTPSAPGVDDDIEIVTRDVELDEFEVRTGEMLQFRHGRSTGSGRALVARLLPKPGGGDSGPAIGGVDTIRIDRDVKLRIEGMEAGLLPGRPPAATPTAGGQPATAAGPVNVSCRGSLCMNVSAGVITLEDHVEVVRELPGGGSEDLTGDLLAIVLERNDGEAGGRRRGLEAREIQAKGTPVVVRSTAAGLEARATRLGYEIASRRILLDGDEPVSLVTRETEVEAKSIDYTPGPGDGPGSLMAVGPGWLKTRPAGGAPALVRWQKWLRVRPDAGEHVASIAGEAEVAVDGQGRLGAAEMHLWLAVAGRERGAAPRGPGAGPDLSGVRPLRLLARGMVEMEADTLAARTDRMEVWFRESSATADVAAAPVGAAPAGPAAGGPGGRPSPARSPAAPRPPAAPTGNRIVATAALIRGLVGMSGREPQLDEMSLEGQVHVVEEQGPAQARRPAAVAAAAAAADEPAQDAALEIRGDQLQISRPTRADARAIVSGRPASVRGRGLDLAGPLVDFDRGRNRLGVDGAGRLEVPLAAGGDGLASFGVTTDAPPVAGRPGALDVTWQGRMDFDGLTARFVDRVVTVGGETTVQSGSLDVIFNRPIEFAVGRPQPAVRPDVTRVACGGGVKLESRSAAQDGSKSVERLFSRDIVIDRASGDVTATGPGRFTSTRFGQAAAIAPPAVPAGPAAPAAAAAPAAPPRPDELTYLGVDFQRGMRGNLGRRVMEFHQRVEAIWGPVARWEDTLDVRAAAGLPPRVVAITADVLGVGQAPPAPGRRRNSVELAAGGNVLVEGEAFTARSARLSYSEAKDLLVFEGDGRSDAQLFRQERVGGTTSSASAGKILFWRSRNHFEVEDARFLDLDQLGKPGRGFTPPVPGGPSARPVSRPLPGT